jgi:hypothetical protein
MPQMWLGSLSQEGRKKKREVKPSKRIERDYVGLCT